MTWQESLRQLDVRLASGDISANEYRKTRDEILAEASSNSSKESDPWSPELADGKEPARREEAAEQDPGETTLVVKVDQSEDDTQIVSADSIPQAVPAAPAVPVGAPGPAGPPAPDVRPAPFRAPPIQGHEVFAEASSGRGGTFTRFLVPLLILALAGAGVWWFALRGGDEETPASPPPSNSSAPVTHDAAEVAKLLPELPGKASDNNGTLPLDRARELKLFTPTYTSLLADDGAGEIVYRGGAQKGVGYLLAAAPIESADGAEAAVKSTTEHLRRAGFEQAPEVSPGDPAVITRTDRAFRTFIAVYSSDNVWIQLNASGAPDGDPEALRTEFQKILAGLIERLPAD